MLKTPDELDRRLARAGRLWLFLDYDGTLAEFAPTPDDVLPDAGLIALLMQLADHPLLRVAVISGRRLSHVQALLPVKGILLAGTYGIEIQMPHGERLERVAYSDVRPVLDRIKPEWQALITGKEGFYLEDKGWAIALHARFASEEDAKNVLIEARQTATGAAGCDSFRILGGHKFLEIGPQQAHKGKTVQFLLDEYDWPGALPVFLGDDDKDEEAFGVVKAHGGVAVLVADRPRETLADVRLASPALAREWLAHLLVLLGSE